MALAGVLCAAAGCNGDDATTPDSDPDGGCEALTEAPLDCTPAFDPPSFGAIYDNVLEPRCGSPGTGPSCHGPEGAMGGLVLFERDVAHAHLLGEVDDRPRVVPGQPGCSELLLRVQSDDPRVRMPLGGTPLDDGVICAIRHWVANGAKGP